MERTIDMDFSQAFMQKAMTYYLNEMVFGAAVNVVSVSRKEGELSSGPDHFVVQLDFLDEKEGDE